MSEERNIKDLLRSSIDQEQQKTRERLDQSTTQQADLASKPDETSESNKTAKIAAPSTESVATTSADDNLLEELKLRYQRIGHDADNLLIIRTGLHKLSTMSGAELRQVIEKVEQKDEESE